MSIFNRNHNQKNEQTTTPTLSTCWMELLHKAMKDNGESVENLIACNMSYEAMTTTISSAHDKPLVVPVLAWSRAYVYYIEEKGYWFCVRGVARTPNMEKRHAFVKGDNLKKFRDFAALFD